MLGGNTHYENIKLKSNLNTLINYVEFLYENEELIEEKDFYNIRAR